MELFFRDLKGKSILINVEEKDTVAQVKQKICAKTGKPINTQRLIYCGQLMQDDKVFSEYESGGLRNFMLVHLVERLAQPIQNSDLFLVVHNFYESVEDAELYGFSKVIPIGGQETPEQLAIYFESMYKIKTERDRKNQSNKAKAMIGLIAIEKNSVEISEGVPDGQQSINAIDLGKPIDYKLLTYSFKGLPVSNTFNLDTKLSNINQAFRLFCAEKIKEEPEYRFEINKNLNKKYGEIRAYVDFTRQSYIDGESLEKQGKILEGIKDLIDNKKIEESNSCYEAIIQFDIKNIRFQATPELKNQKKPEFDYEDVLNEILTELIQQVEVENFFQDSKKRDGNESDLNPRDKGKEKEEEEEDKTPERANNPPFVLVLDMQGTLANTAYIDEKNNHISPQEAYEYISKDQNSYGALPNNWRVTPGTNGVSKQRTLEQLHELKDLGVPIYIATGDGKDTEHSKGCITAPEWVRDKGDDSPIAIENVISWEMLQKNNVSYQNEKGKNGQIKYIKEKEKVNASQIFFLDDGTGNINKAKEIGVEHAYRIDIPQHLTERLDQAINLAKDLKKLQKMSSSSTLTNSTRLKTLGSKKENSVSKRINFRIDVSDKGVDVEVKETDTVKDVKEKLKLKLNQSKITLDLMTSGRPLPDEENFLTYVRLKDGRIPQVSYKISDNNLNRTNNINNSREEGSSSQSTNNLNSKPPVDEENPTDPSGGEGSSSPQQPANQTSSTAASSLSGIFAPASDPLRQPATYNLVDNREDMKGTKPKEKKTLTPETVVLLLLIPVVGWSILVVAAMLCAIDDASRRVFNHETINQGLRP